MIEDPGPNTPPQPVDNFGSLCEHCDELMPDVGSQCTTCGWAEGSTKLACPQCLEYTWDCWEACHECGEIINNE